MANALITRIFEKMRERAAAEHATVLAHEATQVVSSDDDFWIFEDVVESPENPAVNGGAEEDWDAFPLREASRPPTKTRNCRLFDGIRSGRHSYHGNQTPRYKTPRYHK